MTIRVAASLWSVAPERYLATLGRLGAAGVTHIHWDRTDGRFAPPGGFGPAEAAHLTEASSLTAEAHLMVEAPMTEVDAWTEFCDLVVVHAEASNARQALRRIERRGARAGIALARGTPTGAAGLDVPVLVMSIDPGHAGAPFDPGTLDRVAAVRSTSDDQRLVGVDGGVDSGLARRSIAAGGNWIVSGTSLAGADDPADWLRSLRVDETLT